MVRFYFFLLLIIQHLTFYSQNVFTDVTKESGIDHIYNIFESGGFGGGVAVFDFDNDGLEDLEFYIKITEIHLFLTLRSALDLLQMILLLLVPQPPMLTKTGILIYLLLQ